MEGTPVLSETVMSEFFKTFESNYSKGLEENLSESFEALELMAQLSCEKWKLSKKQMLEWLSRPVAQQRVIPLL